MGKKSRRDSRGQQKVRRKPLPYVERPFEGLSAESELVAMAEILPAATITARLTAEHGDREVMFVTLLPNMWSALHRDDGAILVALQTNDRSGDDSRSLASVLLRALEAPEGEAIASAGVLEPGPRLQDVLVPDSFGEIELHNDFEFWLSENAERTAEVKQAIEESSERIIPSDKVEGLPGAYWCRMNREFVRWVRSEDPDKVLDALARLHARRENSFELKGGQSARFVGAFRAEGLIVPVWELPAGAEAEELTTPMASFATVVSEAVAQDEALNADERRARAGLVSRQVSL